MDGQSYGIVVMNFQDTDGLCGSVALNGGKSAKVAWQISIPFMIFAT